MINKTEYYDVRGIALNIYGLIIHNKYYFTLKW